MSYICPKCTYSSNDPDDEKYKYCPTCHQFEETWVNQGSVAAGPDWVWILTAVLVILLLVAMVWTLFR